MSLFQELFYENNPNEESYPVSSSKIYVSSILFKLGLWYTKTLKLILFNTAEMLWCSFETFFILDKGT